MYYVSIVIPIRYSQAKTEMFARNSKHEVWRSRLWGVIEDRYKRKLMYMVMRFSNRLYKDNEYVNINQYVIRIFVYFANRI